LQVTSDGGVAAGQVLFGRHRPAARGSDRDEGRRAGGAGSTATTDERGGYSLPADDGDGAGFDRARRMTTVERLSADQSGLGTIGCGCAGSHRFAPPTVVDAAGGTVTAATIT